MSTTMKTTLYLIILSCIGIHSGLRAEQDPPLPITATELAKGVYMLAGKGGNMGLSIGDNGVLLIDDQYEVQVPGIEAFVAKHSTQGIQFIINTHWHGDHTGGNERIGKTGAIIVAHENVRKAMSKEQFIKTFNLRVPASPDAAKPIITFTESMNFHWNNDNLHIKHVQPSHTDGDAIIYFEKANVLHAGDTFFNKAYPFMDVANGGSIDGLIAVSKQLLALANEKTKIIPGHGPLATKADLIAYKAMLTTLRDRIVKLKTAGKTRDEIIAAKPTEDYDEGWDKGFLKPDVWVGIVYDALP